MNTQQQESCDSSVSDLYASSSFSLDTLHYCNRRTEASGTGLKIEGQVEILREAAQCLERVVKVPHRNEVIENIQGDAQKLLNGIWMGIYMMQGSLEETKQRLTFMLVANPKDTSLLRILRWVQGTLWLEEYNDQAHIIHQQIASNQRQSLQELKMYRESVRGQAQRWYAASLMSAAIAFLVFIGAIVYLILSREAISYLTPLYTLLPGILSALFFTHYIRANQRVDEERDRIWHQVEEFEIQKLKEIEEIRVQVRETIEREQDETTVTDQELL